jgi:SPP1 gp7 family putative phage head morphogenesis protein
MTTQAEWELQNQELTDRYTPIIHRWLRQLYPGYIQLLTFSHERLDPRALSRAQDLTPNSAALAGLVQALRDLYAEVYAGELSPRLDQLIIGAGGVADGIANTLRNRISKVVEMALDGEVPREHLTARLRDVTQNPHQAERIATTEAAYAQSSYETDQMQQRGVVKFDWTTDGDPCPACKAMEDNNPHVVGSEVPPMHPHCRCSISPA